VSAWDKTARDAGAGVTVSVTPIETGLLDAPAAVTVVAPWYEPGVRLVGVTEIARVDGAKPEGVAENHGAFELADQARVPPPGFEMDIDCGEGAAPPMV
jgi:hypothetical protein